MKPRHPRYWEERGACSNAPAEELEAVKARLSEVSGKPIKSHTEAFYPPRKRDQYFEYADLAKNFCFGKDRRHPCPVRKECLLWAIDSDEEHGIFGGLSHRERNALVRKAASKEIPIGDYVESL